MYFGNIFSPVRKYLGEIIATCVASMLHIPLIGFNFAYSAVLIAQLEECQRNITNCTDYVKVTEADSSLIASLITIFIPVGSIIGGFMLDSFGRLTVLKLAAIPGTVGWILLATASNVPMLITGRVFNGFAASWTLSATFVYISEISTPCLRGSMVAVPATLGGVGMAMTYTAGYLLHWRMVAWITLALTVLFSLLIMILPKSPIWLVSKGENKEARASLSWLSKYYDNPDTQVKHQLEVLIKLHTSKEGSSLGTFSKKLRMLTQPTVYKPILILFGLHLFVQSSGLYVMVFYIVSVFEEIGTDINPFVASISFGAVRIIAALLTIGLMRRYNRRQLMIASGLLMGVTIGISALFTKWILEGTTTQMWVPLVMIALYIVATIIGFLTIPIAIPSELFPTEVRGLGQSISMCILYILAFVATLSYYNLKKILGGTSGLQYSFSAMCFAGAIYTFIFLPETHNKSLHELENYFKNNSVYLMHLIRKSKQENNDRSRK